MQHNDTVQRNDSWHAERLGIPTASMYHAIMTEPRTKADKEAGLLSDTAFTYAIELVKQRLTNEVSDLNNTAMQWGTDHEPQAVEAYQALTGNKVIECGFVKHPTLETGASPDGLIGLDGSIEIKCPYNSIHHIKTFLRGEVPKQYIAQVQGQMWVMETEWVDFISYDPRMPEHSQLKIIRVERDEDYISQLAEKVSAFIEKIKDYEQQLIGNATQEQAA